MLLTLPGTPFLYQGEELGLVDAEIPAERVVDPGLRDGCRAPIPWDGSELHGWATDPWLPFPPETDTRNVAAEVADDHSILHLYRRLLTLRKATPALHLGGFELLDGDDGLLAWARTDGGERWFTAINPGDAAAGHGGEMEGATIVLCTDPALDGTTVGATVPPRVALVARRPDTM
jgi:alpha-glucosidase